MFSLFKKQITDEPIQDQINEFKEYLSKLNADIEIQEDCDNLPNSFGEFGISHTNPIPVNGVLGEFKYLHRLRCQCNEMLYFHRIGNKSVEWVEGGIDVYETLCYNGKHWDILYFHMQHPRRSKNIPKGYNFAPFHPEYSTIPIIIGTNLYVENFPFELTPCVKRFFGSTLERFFDRLLNDYENSLKKIQVILFVRKFRLIKLKKHQSIWQRKLALIKKINNLINPTAKFST